MSNRNDKLDEEIAAAEASERLRVLREVQPRESVRFRALAQMKSAREGGHTGKRKRTRWWQRRVAVPVPALLGLIAVLFGIGWKAFLSGPEIQNDSPARQKYVEATPEPVDPPVRLEQKASPPISLRVGRRREVAVYLPTIGYISEQTTINYTEEDYDD